LDIEKVKKTLEAACANVSTVAIEMQVLNSRLQAIGQSPVKKKWC